jgi:hypothetical protein
MTILNRARLYTHPDYELTAIPNGEFTTLRFQKRSHLLQPDERVHVFEVDVRNDATDDEIKRVCYR